MKKTQKMWQDYKYWHLENEDSIKNEMKNETQEVWWIKTGPEYKEKSGGLLRKSWFQQ